MDFSLDRTGARRPRARTVVLALAAALGMPALVHARVEAVTNCNDSGAGSLRDAVANAAPGSTVDLSMLTCGTITLTSGAISVTQSALTLNGPGEDALTIDGYFADRVFMHLGGDTLRLVGLTVANGKYRSNTEPHGGCILSTGNVELISSAVTGCSTEALAQFSAEGGGIYASGSISLIGSRVTGNTVRATGSTTTTALGGGALSMGAMYLKYSTVSDNNAYASGDNFSAAGGLLAGGEATISYSTISGNYAQFFGGASLRGPAAATITDSTISGNRATRVSGVYAMVPLTVSNSTIASNVSDFGNGALFDAGTLELQSTIVAGNESLLGPAEDDLYGNQGAVAAGANNLIVTSNIPVPADTTSVCPHLLPLDAYGGPTATHALRSDSPAIDFGNNALGLDVDQRQADRIFGATADIGAVEWNGDPGFAFRSGFEPVCDG